MANGELEGGCGESPRLSCQAQGCFHELENGYFPTWVGVTPEDLRAFADHLESHDGNESV